MDDTQTMTLARREALQAISENQVTGTDASFRAGGAGEPITQAVAWNIQQGYASYQKRDRRASPVLVTPAGRAALATDAERPQRKSAAKAPPSPPISASTPATEPPRPKA